MPTTKLLARPAVEEMTGLTRSSIYRLMRKGHFPEPKRIGERAVRWELDELTAWIENRPRATGQATA